MSLGSKMTWTGLVSLAVLLGARGVCLAEPEDTAAAAGVAPAFEESDNPYSVITKRNVFGLNPPPPPPEPEKGAPPAVPVVHLNGFMRKGEEWKVLLAVEVENPDPHGHPLTCYLTLAEGDKKTVGSGTKQAAVELVKAYADKEKVDIINSGTPMSLSVKDNGIDKAAPPPAGHGGAVFLRKPHLAAPLPVTPPPPAAMPATAAAPAAGENPRTEGGAPPRAEPLAPTRESPSRGNIIIAGGAAGEPK